MATSAATKPLATHQIAALRALAVNPNNGYMSAGHVEAGTLAFLRRNGLVGKVKARAGGHAVTQSPITDAGRALLAALDAGPLSPESAAMLRAGIESGRMEPSVYLGSFAENNEEERG